MIDNASYYRSSLVRDFMTVKGVTCLFLGPYHFKMAPVEHLFAFIKSHDLNPMRIKASS
jgi:transposase